MYGSPATSKDLDLSFPYHRKEDSDLHRQHQHQHQQQMSSGLLRYRSAPSSLFGEGGEDFLPGRPSSPETDTMLARFLSSDPRDKPLATGAGGGRGSPQFPPPQPAAAAVEHRGAQENPIAGFSSAPPHMLYHSHQQQQQQQQHQHQIPSHGSVEGSYRAVGSIAMDTEQLKSGSCPSLIRHSSSPAGLFSHLNVENGGYGMMRSVSGMRNNGNGSIGEAGMANRLKNQISFSSRQGSLMSQISEIGSEGMGGSSPEESSLGSNTGGGGGRCYVPGYPITSWEDSTMLTDNFSGLKRAREAGLNPPDAQNGEARNNVGSLTHQFSLPKTSAEMAAMEKFLQLQDAVPCKVRAKRGCATHPRSIAERVRRTRISERMRKLQELVPNMDKQTNTADMLDLAVEYIKELQRQVKSLSENRTSCTCSSSKQKPYSTV